MSTHGRTNGWAGGRASSSAFAAVGFTLIELLVAVSIIGIAAALTLPAISQIVRSNNYASAVNSVTATLSSARGIAVRRQTYAGVVFLWDAQREVMSLQVIELGSKQTGRLSATSTDLARNSAAAFWPAANTAAVELPRGTGVYGLAMGYELPRFNEAGGQIDNRTAHWYAGWRYEDNTGEELTPWLFPNNDPRTKLDQLPPRISPDRVGVDPFSDAVVSGAVSGVGNSTVRMALRHSQSFMVLFSPQGAMTTSIRVGGKTVNWAFLEYPEDPRLPDALPSDRPFDTVLLFDPEIPVVSTVAGARRVPNAEVLMAPVPTIAVVDLRAMGEAQNPADPTVSAYQNDGRLVADRRPWLIMPEGVEEWLVDWPDWVANPSASRPYFDDGRFGAACRWIDRNGEIISFNRYTGQVLRSTRQ